MANVTVLTSTMTMLCYAYAKNTCIRRVMLARPLEVWSLAIDFQKRLKAGFSSLELSWLQFP